MTKLIAFCTLTGLLAVSGCASQQQLVGQKEDLLAAAGFQIRIADNPQRLAAMRSLPPNKFVTRVVNGQPVYLYADPLVCRCVYFGTQQNWAAYRQEVFAKQLADSTAGLEVIELLDEVFETLTAPLRSRGGQVLKFMGDGMLAIFPLLAKTQAETCRNAIASAREAMHALDRVNRARAVRLFPGFSNFHAAHSPAAACWV